MLKRLVKDQRGATLIEYAGLAVLILIGIWAAAASMTSDIGDRFEDIGERIGD